MSYNTVPVLYGSLYNYSTNYTVNTSGGGFVQLTNFTAGDSLNTTLSTASSNITINQTQKVIIEASVCVHNTSGTFYYIGIYVNGTSINPGYQGQTDIVSSYYTYRNKCVYNATYGDVVDIRIHAQNGSDPSNRPDIYNSTLLVIGA